MNGKKNLMMYLVSIYKYKIYRKLASMLIKALCIDTCCIRRDVPYMYFKVVINTIIHFSFSATRVISKCILIFPNKTDNSVHKAIIGKFKNICSNYQVYVIFKVFFYFRSKKFFIIFLA